MKLKLPCLWGKLPKRVFLEVSEDVLMSFCVAGVPPCDMRCVSAGMCARGRHQGKVAVSLPEARRGVFLDVSEDVIMLFWVAGMALCDIRCA